jgi:hypothetical protein
MTTGNTLDSHQKNFFDAIIFFLEKHWYIVMTTVFLVTTLFIASRVDISLLFSDTIVTGGDSASWLQTVHHLKDTLIPGGRLFGYSLSNFFGFEELQFYFIPPFLMAVALSLFMPATIALKIATVAGIFALPLTAFIAIRWITRNVWLSAASSFLMLIFIFNESYTMFGGNYLSTLAGEFCYSHSIAWFLLFFGYLWRTFERKGNPVFAGILLGIVGLNHLFVFMPAFFLPFFFAVHGLFTSGVKRVAGTGGNRGKKKKKKNSKGKKDTFTSEFDPVLTAGLGTTLARTGIVYLSAILVMAFWLVPFIAKRQFATSLRLVWQFNSFGEFFKQSFLLLGLAGFVINVAAFILDRRSRKLTLMITWFYAACGFIYFASALLGIPDIRFIPPVLVISLLAVVQLFAILSRMLTSARPGLARFRPETAWLAVSIITGIVFSINAVHNLPVWFEWNNSGYESKPSWPQLEVISRKSAGSAADGRLLWEKLPFRDNTDFGSERAFENSYMFTGRPSMEGVHYGSSFMSRAITYLQSEYSENTRDPEYRYRLYSQVNPQSWVYRFHQVNGRDIIVYSNRMKQFFSADPNFSLLYDASRFATPSSTGKKFHVYRFNESPDSYIEVLEPGQLQVIDDNRFGFERDFYRYFRDYELTAYPFVPSGFADKSLEGFTRFKTYDAYYRRFYKPANPAEFLSEVKKKGSPISGEEIDTFSMKFETAAVGRPHIIKMSYSPNFRSRNGEKIYPVSPGFMLIIPESETVELVYGPVFSEVLGLILTLLSLILLAVSLRWPSLAESASLPAPRVVASFLLGGVIITAMVMLWMSLFGVLRYERDFEKSQQLYHAKNDAARAWSIVSRQATYENVDRYDNVFSFNFMVFKASMLHELYGKDKEALEILDYLEKRYRHVKKIYSVNNVRRQILSSRSYSRQGSR